MTLVVSNMKTLFSPRTIGNALLLYLQMPHTLTFFPLANGLYRVTSPADEKVVCIFVEDLMCFLRSCSRLKSFKNKMGFFSFVCIIGTTTFISTECHHLTGLSVIILIRDNFYLLTLCNRDI